MFAWKDRTFMEGSAYKDNMEGNKKGLTRKHILLIHWQSL